ncbi:hypothetical protein [Paraburkholderia sp.]|uniref:hypothetical protein n=1 Tax=Paraburkholderia sp. TaxID=1926495 RepID=UPI0039E3A2F1
MTRTNLRVWLMPVVINVAILAGLALALLIDADTARAFAWVLLAIPVGVIGYGCFRKERPRAHRRG